MGQIASELKTLKIGPTAAMSDAQAIAKFRHKLFFFFKLFLYSFIILGVRFSVNMGGKEIDFFNILGWSLYN